MNRKHLGVDAELVPRPEHHRLEPRGQRHAAQLPHHLRELAVRARRVDDAAARAALAEATRCTPGGGGHSHSPCGGNGPGELVVGQFNSIKKRDHEKAQKRARKLKRDQKRPENRPGKGAEKCSAIELPPPRAAVLPVPVGDSRSAFCARITACTTEFVYSSWHG